MNPENHMVVRLLRHLNFNMAADKLVDSLLGDDEVFIHPDVLAAADQIQRRMSLSTNEGLFAANDPQNMKVIFDRVAQQFNLSSLDNPLINVTNDLVQ
ncbi:hypothetical protein [Legionella brunensis]|uniref:Uncharacterized protein n=1 Tax=Legionella brunensis TaxID=29422 RepID=A0A0W0S0V5_9GAMM|nr:hypothetical protein [Legionella brunensis]KTC76958.1 hypothetical protein Lbru_3065 [Legionella brunensis]